jgi:hypothetical protein
MFSHYKERQTRWEINNKSVMSQAALKEKEHGFYFSDEIHIINKVVTMGNNYLGGGNYKRRTMW